MRIGVTGATGFVGSALVPHLLEFGHGVVALTRSRDGDLPPGAERRPTGAVESAADLAPALRGLDAVVHLAGLAHRPRGSEPAAAYARANAEATRRLGEAAAAAGVPRLVFVSTLLVHGDESPRGPEGAPRALRAADPPRPADAYSASKWAAEEALREVSAATGLEVAVLRPPLVHGPGAKGNLAALMRWLDRRLPLPFAGLRNRRSLVGAANLASLLRLLATRPGASGAYLVRDGEDVSTPELARALGAALSRPARLLPCPPGLMRAAAALAGRPALARSLTGSLFVDDTGTRRALGWAPHLSLQDGLANMVTAWRERGA